MTESNWGDPSAVGSFAWAIDQSNKNSGHDVINLKPSGTQISVDIPGASVLSSFLAVITDDLTINGNGVTLVGNPSFVASNGVVYDKHTLSEFGAGVNDILTQEAYSFARLAKDTSLEIRGLSTDGMNGFLDLQANSSAVVSCGA